MPTVYVDSGYGSGIVGNSAIGIDGIAPDIDADVEVSGAVQQLMSSTNKHMTPKEAVAELDELLALCRTSTLYR